MNDINRLFYFGWVELVLFYILSIFSIFFIYKLNCYISKKNKYTLNLIGVYLSIGLGIIFALIFGVGIDFPIGELFIRHGNETTIRISSLILALTCLFTYPKEKK